MKRAIKHYNYYQEAMSAKDEIPANPDAQNNPTPTATPTPPADNPPPEQQPSPMGGQGLEPVKPSLEDPNEPDMPQEDDEQEFNEWRNEFFKLAINGDVNKMIDAVGKIRDTEGLSAAQRKFIEDNLQILRLRQDANFEKISKEIRRSIKTDIDHEHPGVSLAQIIGGAIETNPLLNEVYLKLVGFYGMKGEIHRKFLGAITGSVQTGGGASKEDLVYNEKDYSINVSTRCASDFGEINIGKWSLEEHEPEEFLQEPEMNRLEEGSPEEKKALLHRVVLESIAKRFKKRAFLIDIIDDEGTTHHIGWDLGDSLLDAYKEGVLVVHTDHTETKDLVIGEDGNFIPLKNIGIFAKMPDTDEMGKSSHRLVPFISNRSGILYFTAEKDTIENLGNVSGLVYKASPYAGNQNELQDLIRCVPSMVELLLRRC